MNVQKGRKDEEVEESMPLVECLRQKLAAFQLHMPMMLREWNLGQLLKRQHCLGVEPEGAEKAAEMTGITITLKKNNSTA